jgi:hypothetical protein
MQWEAHRQQRSFFKRFFLCVFRGFRNASLRSLNGPQPFSEKPFRKQAKKQMLLPVSFPLHKSVATVS